MRKLISLLLVLCLSVLVWAQPLLEKILPVWIEDEVGPNYKIFTAIGLQHSKWVGHPDSNYAWDGDMLSYERTDKDENGKDVLVKTYKKPIEIIANFKPASKVSGIAGNIERNAVEKFGGFLKGFIWLDKVAGGGEVVLPFTAEHIFIARGDRLNPVLTEIGTEGDDYYEIFEGRTHVYVKAFSGIGGAAGAPPTLIAHYKFNEDTSGDSTDLIGGGDFATADWDGDDPDPTYWTVTGEVTTDPEVSEVGTGEGHGGAGTGYCNFYTTGDLIKITQDIDLVIGRKYRFSVNVDKITTGGLKIEIGASGVDFNGFYSGSETGTQGGTFVAVTGANTSVELRRNVGAADITFDDVSIKLLAVEDSSGNDHDALAQQDTSVIHRAGKINGAFDFTPNDYILIPDHDDFTSVKSISVWVYMHDAQSFSIASKHITGKREWTFYVSIGRKLYGFFITQSTGNRIGRYYNTSLAAYENQLVHFVLTFNGVDTIKLYINSVRVDDTDYNSGSFTTVENTGAPIFIGRYVNAYANGLIDNPMFFGVELTQDEVNILCNNGSGTEIPAELDSKISPRRSNLSSLPLRRRYEW